MPSAFYKQPESQTKVRSPLRPVLLQTQSLLKRTGLIQGKGYGGSPCGWQELYPTTTMARPPTAAAVAWWQKGKIVDLSSFLRHRRNMG